jgi:hypothetical protein
LQKEQGTETQMSKIIRRLSNILNITKENRGRGRNSGRAEAAVTAAGVGLLDPKNVLSEINFG